MIALQNKPLVYAILFRAMAETLQTIAADSRHLGAEIGLFAVLTRGQKREASRPRLPQTQPQNRQGGSAQNEPNYKSKKQR